MKIWNVSWFRYRMKVSAVHLYRCSNRNYYRPDEVVLSVGTGDIETRELLEDVYVPFWSVAEY